MIEEPIELLLPPAAVIERVVRIALEEDLGRGDVTTAACVPATAEGKASINARDDMVVSGLCVLDEVLRQVDPNVSVERDVQEGERLEAGATISRLAGRAASILMAERVALNFLQRLCGIATLTRAYVDALPTKSRTRIVDTRKTTPGLRALERFAVRCGGGYNHREDLSSAVLIKDNHVAICGGVRTAIQRARARAPHTTRIECEVDSLEQLREAIQAGVDVVLLDNFDDAHVREALSIIAGRAIVEVSGGVSLSRIASLAAAGVDVISIGALTHSPKSADIGLDW